MTNTQKGLSLLIVPLVLVAAITAITTCARAGKGPDNAALSEQLVILQETIDVQGLLIGSLNTQLTSQTQTINELNSVIEAQTGVIEQLAASEEGPIIVESVGGSMVCEWQHEGEQP